MPHSLLWRAPPETTGSADYTRWSLRLLQNAWKSLDEADPSWLKDAMAESLEEAKKVGCQNLLASCAFGSTHQKGFCFVSVNMQCWRWGGGALAIAIMLAFEANILDLQLFTVMDLQLLWLTHLL